MTELTAPELASMQSVESGSLPDSGTVFRSSKTDDGRGGYTTAYISRGTVPARYSQSSTTGGGNVARPVGGRWVDDPVWDIVLPYGTTVQDDDRIAVGGRWFEVEAITEQTWETAVHVVGSEGFQPAATYDSESQYNVQTNLTYYFPLSEASGNRFDLISGGTAVEFGTVGGTVDALFGSAMYNDQTGGFGASTKHVYVPETDPALVFQGAFTFAKWIRPLQLGSFDCYGSKYDEAGGDRSFAVWQLGGTTSANFYAPPADGVVIGGTTPIVAGSPYYLVLTRNDDNVCSYYVNGVLMGTVLHTYDYGARDDKLNVDRATVIRPNTGIHAKMAWFNNYGVTAADVAWLYNGGTPRADSDMTG